MTNKPLTRQLYTYHLSTEPTHVHSHDYDCKEYCEREREEIPLFKIFDSDNVLSAVEGLRINLCNCYLTGKFKPCKSCKSIDKWFPVSQRRKRNNE